MLWSPSPTTASPTVLLLQILTLFLVIPAYIVIAAPTGDDHEFHGKPTVVLVPGAWHSPIHYVELIAYLELAGYRIVSARNPSCNSPNPDAQSVAGDAAAIRNNLILPQINAGKDVVLTVHSYGGQPGAVAAKGLSKTERRAAGLPGGIIGLVFICAFIAEEGQSLVSTLPGQKLNDWVIDYGDGQLGVSNAKNIFYADVPSPVDDLAIAEIKNQSKASLFSPSGPPAWKDAVFNGRRAYAHTLMDNGIPPFAQNLMLQASGVQWDIQNFSTSHSPFLSMPKQLSQFLVQEMQKFSSEEPEHRDN